MKSIVIIEITKRNGAFLSCTGHLGGIGVIFAFVRINWCKLRCLHDCDIDVMMTPLSYVCIAVSLT